MASKTISGIYRSVGKDGTITTLACVYTDAVGPDATVPDEAEFNRINEEVLEETKDRDEIDGVIYIPR